MEATILKWHKQPGEKVAMDETVLEIATDKVDSEVPSTAAGTISEILYNVNDVVPIGTVIARISTSATETVSDRPVISTPGREQRTQESTEKTEEAVVVETFQHAPASYQHQGQNGNPNNSNRFYSPLVLNIAASEGISLSELEKINGTGNEGRVTKKDILQYVSDRKSGARKKESAPSYTNSDIPQQSEAAGQRQVERQKQTETSSALTTYSGNVEIIEMDRMRKLIADHMVRSKHTSPHVTSFTEADVTNLVLWRDRVKKDFEKREGTKITFTPLFIEAIVRCIKRFPLVNCSIDDHSSY